MGKNFFAGWTDSMVAEYNRKTKPRPVLVNVVRNDARYKIPPFTPVTFNLLNYEREEIRKFVPIVPMGAVRSNRHTHNERVEKYHTYLKQVRFFFKEFGELEVPDEIQIKALFPTEVKERWTFPHRQKPDVDNLEKGIFDSLFKNDAAIWSSQIQKFWCEPGQEGMNVILIYFRKKAG